MGTKVALSLEGVPVEPCLSSSGCIALANDCWTCTTVCVGLLIFVPTQKRNDEPFSGPIGDTINVSIN